MITNMIGCLEGFPKSLRHCALDESSLSIGRVKQASRTCPAPDSKEN